MARYGDLDTQYFDDAGDPLINGKIFFFETGTTTPKPTFSDVNFTIPNAHPVILTAAGRQPNIFFQGVAKAVLATSAGVQILVRDPVGETASTFGNPWVASKDYNANDVVQGSDGNFYRSLVNGNVNNNPVTTTGSWTFLYSVEWSAGTTYKTGSVVTYETIVYQSLQNANLNQNPSSATSYWVPIQLVWSATSVYALNANVVGTDGILYTSLQAANTGNIPASSASFWVGSSAAAASSATAAAASASAASTSATNAAASASTATTQATNAATSASNASTSASNASTSATNAAASASSASTSASSATSSASSATSSASSATSSASAASTSATNAAASASAASGSASTASTQATNAAASASTATTAATNAGTSETNAAASASTATTQATNASNSATSASTSASNASTSATNAATSATAAAASFDSFDDRFLGAKASDPTLDNDGNALVEGALYFNSTTDTSRVYNGTAWQDVAPVATSINVGTQVTGILNVVNGGTGLSTLGTAGQVLTVNSGATALEYQPLPASAGTIQAVATGSLANGDKIIINADGTVSAVSGALEIAGTPVDFEAASTSFISATYDSTNNRVIVGYQDSGNSNQGTAIVGTVSGSSISFGTAVVFDSGNINSTSMTYDTTNNRVVIAYRDSSVSVGRAIVGTVSGTSISFGTAVQFESTNCTLTSIAYDSTNNRVVIAYMLSSDFFGYAIVGTVSGTSISFGTRVGFSYANIFGSSTATVYSTTNNKIVIAYRDSDASNVGKAIVGTVSGTSISFGSPAVFKNTATELISAAYDSTNNKIIIAFCDTSNSNFGTAVVGTVSGTSISFGTPVVFESASIAGSVRIGVSYNSTRQKAVIVYRDAGNSNYGTVIGASVTGTTLTFEAALVFQSAATEALQATYDSTNNRTVIAYRNSTGFGRCVVYESGFTNLTQENYIGVANAAYANAATATIQTVGSTDDAQTGLTAGQQYFLLADGSLALTPSTPSVFAGTAISASKLIIKG